MVEVDALSVVLVDAATVVNEVDSLLLLVLDIPTSELDSTAKELDEVLDAAASEELNINEVVPRAVEDVDDNTLFDVAMVVAAFVDVIASATADTAAVVVADVEAVVEVVFAVVVEVCATEVVEVEAACVLDVATALFVDEAACVEDVVVCAVVE